MLYFIDQTSEKDHHMVFNSSIIRTLLALYPEQRLVYYGVGSSQQSVKSLLNKEEFDRIELRPIVYSKAKSEAKFFKIINFVKKERLRFSMFKEMFKNAGKDDLVFLSITTFISFYFFKRLKRKFKTNTIATLHGEMDFIYQYSNLLEKVDGMVHKKIFKIQAPNFRYLVLNKIAKKILVKDGYLKEEEVLEINHPFSALRLPSQKNFENQNAFSVTFGHIGSMEIEHKNSHYFYQIAEEFKQEIIDKKAVFKTIGLITPVMLPHKNEWVEEVVGNTRPDKPDYLSRDEYESNVDQLDFSLFFYPENQYVFRASGAVIDAVAFKTPIVVLKHPFFDNLFAQAGPIGYICSDMKEFEDTIRKIIDRDNNFVADYKVFTENIKNLREKFTVEQIVSDLKNQLKV